MSRQCVFSRRWRVPRVRICFSGVVTVMSLLPLVLCMVSEDETRGLWAAGWFAAAAGIGLYYQSWLIGCTLAGMLLGMVQEPASGVSDQAFRLLVYAVAGACVGLLFDFVDEQER